MLAPISETKKEIVLLGHDFWRRMYRYVIFQINFLENGFFPGSLFKMMTWES